MNPNQEVFNRAWNHILKQGKPSIELDKKGRISCRYLSPEGLSCAFAPCIKDYSPNFEDMTALALINHHPEALHNFALAADKDLCSDVQSAHDRAGPTASFLDNFKLDMHRIATKYNLEIPDENSIV